MDLVFWYVSAVLFTALVVGAGLWTAYVWNQDPDARRGLFLRRVPLPLHRAAARLRHVPLRDRDRLIG